MREGWCFRCRKMGHNAQNCRVTFPTTSSTSPHPQQIRTTEIAPLKSESKNPFITATPTHSVLDEYVNTLKTSGKEDKEILEVLKTCNEEPAAEVAEISTPGITDF